MTKDETLPKRAREALHAIAAFDAPPPPSHWAVRVIASVLDDLDRVRADRTGGGCPTCGRTPHPPAAGAEETAFPGWAWNTPRGWDSPGGAQDLRDALRYLTCETRWTFPLLDKVNLQKLDLALVAWERIVYGATDPCTYCGRSSAEEAAREREQSSAATLKDRERWATVLRDLVAACRSFDIGLGWDGWHACADYDDEDEFNAELKRAEASLGEVPAPDGGEVRNLAQKLVVACRSFKGTFHDNNSRATIGEKSLTAWRAEWKKANEEVEKLAPSPGDPRSDSTRLRYGDWERIS